MNGPPTTRTGRAPRSCATPSSGSTAHGDDMVGGFGIRHAFEHFLPGGRHSTSWVSRAC